MGSARPGWRLLALHPRVAMRLQPPISCLAAVLGAAGALTAREGLVRAHAFYDTLTFNDFWRRLAP